jgi:hypothetical protein
MLLTLVNQIRFPCCVKIPHRGLGVLNSESDRRSSGGGTVAAEAAEAAMATAETADGEKAAAGVDATIEPRPKVLSPLERIE